MASVVVVDSGILIASVLEETWTTKAEALLEYWSTTNVQLTAPLLFRYEIVAVIRRAVWHQRITPDEGEEARDYLLAQPITYHFDDTLLKRAYELATEHNRPTAYDAQYLAVAERLYCEFWTADERLFNAVQEAMDWVKWVGRFEQAG